MTRTADSVLSTKTEDTRLFIKVIDKFIIVV